MRLRTVTLTIVGTVLFVTFAASNVQAADGTPLHCGPLPPPLAKVQFDDHFHRSSLGDSYDVHDGPGAVEVGRRLWYHARPRGVEMANDANLGIDQLGRPYAPSLAIARRFWGDRWTLETRATYHGFQDGATGSERDVYLRVASAPFTDPQRFLVEIDRYNDDPGFPSRGALYVIYGSRKATKIKMPLNPADSYFWRIERQGRTIVVGASSDGHCYSWTKHDFGSNGGGMEQTFLIVGNAFDPSGSAELDYLTIRSPVLPTTRPTKSHRVLGTKLPKTVRAEVIAHAINTGTDVDIENATVLGDLRLTGANPSLASPEGGPPKLTGRLTCKKCTFSGRIISPWKTFTNDVSLVNSTMKAGVSFLGGKFLAKADFSGSRFEDVAQFSSATFSKRGADFSGARFEDSTTRAWFRGADFQGEASFYGVEFKGGADFSTTYKYGDQYTPATFEDKVTFSDISVGKDTDLVFYKAVFDKAVYFYVAPARRHSDDGDDRLAALFPKQPVVPSGSWGQDLSFEGAKFFSKASKGETALRGLSPDSGRSGLIFSTDDPDTPQERFGPSSWAATARITLRDAELGQLTINNLAFKGVVDLRGARFTGGPDSIRLFNADFDSVLLDEWPSTKVVATRRTRDALVGMFEKEDELALARIAYFDLLASSTAYDSWLRDNAIPKIDPKTNKELEPRPESYRGYPAFLLGQGLLNIFRITGYGTSTGEVLLQGFALVILFSVVLFALDRNGSLVRTDQPRKFTLRLADTPTMRAHDRIVEASTAPKYRVSAARRAYCALLFSLGNITKFGGFEVVRLRLTQETPKAAAAALNVTAWLAWSLGYLWIAIVIYSVTAIPALKGLVK